MMRVILLTSLFVLAALAGCLDSEDNGPSTDNPGSSGSSNISNPDEFVRTSQAAHPAFGWPTPADYSGFTGSQIPESWMIPEQVEIPADISSIAHVATTEGVAAGAGIAAFGHYIVASGNGPGTIIDIADPTNPVKVADLEISTRDADILMYPDGRTIAVMASNGPIHLFDVTDPLNFEQLPDLEVGSHNAVVVPGTPYVYNANSAGGATGNVGPLTVLEQNGVTEIFDLTDPENPVRLPDFANGYGCHDITFFITEEKQRAYCAGIEMTQIWDIADPANPSVLVNIPVHHGVAETPSASVTLVLFSHLAMVSNDGDTLIVGDETGGGLAPACDVGVDTGIAGVVSGPLGNLWVYDLSDEMNPLLTQWYSPTNHIPTAVLTGADPLAGCTAHFGRVVEDRDLLAIGFYGNGVVLVDYSNPSALSIEAQYINNSNIWDVWEWQGYLYTGDLNNGVEVLQLL